MNYCFLGKFNLALDDKCRMRLPAKLRAAIGTGYVVMYGADCLSVMPKEDFESLNEKFRSIPYSDVEARRAVSDILGNAFEPEEDAQGRFVIPKHSRDYAAIVKNVVVVGAGNIIEIWGEERYEKTHTVSSYADKLKALAQYGI